MNTRRTALSTIGYEATNLADFIVTLRHAGISRLIDVRELAISRRKGFAKRALSEALADAGIDYVHLRGLGDPKEGREAARAGDVARFKQVFTGHMESAVAQADLERAMHLVNEGGACLMCYERDHAACHRTIVAQAISGSMQVVIRHLRVREGLARDSNQSENSELVAEARA